jgi:hypothetical protein
MYLLIGFATFSSLLFIFLYRNENGFNIFGYDQRGFKKNKLYRGRFKYSKDGYDYNGYNRKGFNEEGFNAKGYDQTGFDRKGYDLQGYNRQGFNEKGFNRLGYDVKGYDKNGYDSSGFDRKGFDIRGFDKDGYNHNGFNELGIDREGFNDKGFNEQGFNRKGFNAEGFDAKGFNNKSFNREGFNIFGENEDGIPWWYFNLNHLKDLKNKGITTQTKKFYKFNSESFIRPNLTKSQKPDKGSSTILKNPFFILGLNPTSPAKVIQRRVNDMIKLSSIGQNHQFDYDVVSLNADRTEANIKEAGAKLLIPGDRINALFFWFNFENEDTKKLFQQNSLEMVINLLNKQYIMENDILALKNAIIGSVLLSTINLDIKPAVLMMEYWLEVIKSKLIWNQLSTLFNESQEIQLNTNPVDDFKMKVADCIGDCYYQLYVLDPKDTLMHKYFELFNQYPEKYITNVIVLKLNEANQLSDIIDEFKSNVNSSQELTLNARKSINEFIDKINKFNHFLEEYQLMKRNDVVEVKEKLAQKMRNLAIDVFNSAETNSSDFKLGESCLDLALSLTNSSVLKARITKDKNDIQEGKQRKSLIDAIQRDLRNDAYESARSKIKQLEATDSGYENKRFANSLMIISYKNEFSAQYAKAIRDANQLTDNFGYSSNPYAAKQAIAGKIKDAIQALNGLIIVAEKEDNYKEKNKYQDMKDNLVSQHREITTLL